MKASSALRFGSVFISPQLLRNGKNSSYPLHLGEISIAIYLVFNLIRLLLEVDCQVSQVLGSNCRNYLAGFRQKADHEALRFRALDILEVLETQLQNRNILVQVLRSASSRKNIYF